MNPSDDCIRIHFLPADDHLSAVSSSSSSSSYQFTDSSCHLPANCPPPSGYDVTNRQYGMSHEMNPSHRNDFAFIYDSYHSHGHSYEATDNIRSSSSGVDWMMSERKNNSSNAFIYHEHVNDSNPREEISRDVSTYYPDESLDSGLTTGSSVNWAYNSSPVRNISTNTGVSYPSPGERRNAYRRGNTDPVNVASTKMRKNDHPSDEKMHDKRSNDRSQRFSVTVEFLKSCNLYDITMKTARFIEQNSQFQEQIDLFSGEITTILAPSFVNRL